MKKEFIETQVFIKNWTSLGLADDDLRKLQVHILKNPKTGDIMQGTGGLTKLRWTLPNTGKSGGIRVLYVDFVTHEKIILVNCYSKSEQDNISDKDKSTYKSFISEIKKVL